MADGPAGPGQAPGPREDATGRGIAWPVLLIGQDDRFVHVLDRRGLRLHHDGAAVPEAGRATDGGPPAAPVDHFDRDGQRLRPVVGDGGLRDLEPTGVFEPQAVLLARLRTAVRWARGELRARGTTVVVAPHLPDEDYGGYLDDLAQVFAAQPGDGSSWHNFMHLIT